MLDVAAGGAEGIAGERYRHPGCPIEASPAPGVFVDSRRESKDRIGMPTPPPRVFLSKSAEAIENKGRRTEKERQERKRVRKDKELKEIEEEDAKGSAGFVRHNTANHTTVP
jgi:hypothetical protein